MWKVCVFVTFCYVELKAIKILKYIYIFIHVFFIFLAGKDGACLPWCGALPFFYCFCLFVLCLVLLLVSVLPETNYWT